MSSKLAQEKPAHGPPKFSNLERKISRLTNLTLHNHPTTFTMAKDKSEKKVKKEKRSEVDGVKKSKKEKKDKKPKSKDKLEAALLNQLEADEPVKASEDDESPAPVAAANGVSKAAEVDDEMEVELKVIPKEALVPFAFPLADEKQTKKLLKGVKKGELVLLRCRGDHTYMPFSLKSEVHQARRQGSREMRPQIRVQWSLLLGRDRPNLNRHPRRRYLAYGRYLTYPGSLRRPQYSLYLRHIARRARCCRKHKKADECCTTYQGQRCEGQGWRERVGRIQGGVHGSAEACVEGGSYCQDMRHLTGKGCSCSMWSMAIRKWRLGAKVGFLLGMWSSRISITGIKNHNQQKNTKRVRASTSNFSLFPYFISLSAQYFPIPDLHFSTPPSSPFSHSSH